MIDVDELLDELEDADVGETIESLPPGPLAIEAFGRNDVDPGEVGRD